MNTLNLKDDAPEGPMDRRSSTLRTILDNKVGAALIVAAVFGILAWVSGVSALPSKVENQSVRLTATEVKVETLERNEIRHEAKQDQIIETLREIKEDVKQLRRR